MGRSVLSPPVANIPDFDAKLLSDLAGRLAAVTPMVHYRTLKLFGITFPRFAPFGATVLVHNSLVSDPRNRVQFFGGRAPRVCIFSLPSSISHHVRATENARFAGPGLRQDLGWPPAIGQ